ncbi:MAG: AbrB/MazE/SpoVT family DNA-binding domain-containing protein [Chloroflexota bacterium]
MNQLIQLSLDELGRIFIPAPLRQRLHLSPGMSLVVEKGEQGGVNLRILRQPPVLVEKDGILVARVVPISELSNITRRERDRRVFDLLQRVGL